jgi:hypothetical protein
VSPSITRIRIASVKTTGVDVEVKIGVGVGAVAVEVRLGVAAGVSDAATVEVSVGSAVKVETMVAETGREVKTAWSVGEGDGVAAITIAEDWADVAAGCVNKVGVARADDLIGVCVKAIVSVGVGAGAIGVRGRVTAVASAMTPIPVAPRARKEWLRFIGI